MSVNIELRALKAALSNAVHWKILSENPFKELRLLRVPDQLPTYFSKEDFLKILALVQEDWFKDLIIVAVSTGLRRGELLNLTWQDVDLERRHLSIHSSKAFKTKSGKRRTVPMNESVAQIIERRKRVNDSEYVFSFDGKQIHGDLVTKKLKCYVREGGINSRLHFHSLRHTFATWLVQDSVSIYEIQKLLEGRPRTPCFQEE